MEKFSINGGGISLQREKEISELVDEIVGDESNAEYEKLNKALEAAKNVEEAIIIALIFGYVSGLNAGKDLYNSFPIDTDPTIIQACIQNIKDNPEKRYAGCTTTATEIQVHYIVGYTPPTNKIEWSKRVRRKVASKEQQAALGFLNFNPLNHCIHRDECPLDNIIRSRYHLTDSFSNHPMGDADIKMAEQSIYYVKEAKKLGVLKHIHITPPVLARIIYDFRYKADLTYYNACTILNKKIYDIVVDLAKKYKAKLISSSLYDTVDEHTHESVQYKIYTVSVKHPDYKRRVELNIFLYYKSDHGYLLSTIHTVLSSIDYYTNLKW